MRGLSPSWQEPSRRGRPGTPLGEAKVPARTALCQFPPFSPPARLSDRGAPFTSPSAHARASSFSSTTRGGQWQAGATNSVDAGSRNDRLGWLDPVRGEGPRERTEQSFGGEPMKHRLLWVNDESTVFVEAWVQDGDTLEDALEVYVATRPNRNATWGPPIKVTRGRNR